MGSLRNRDTESDDLLREYERRMRRSAEYHQGLTALHLPPESREKFEPDGTAKPLLGFTLVQWIDPRTDLFVHLVDVCTKLEHSLRKPWVDAEGRSRESIASRFAFLPAETFHMTVFDLVVEPDEATTADLPRLVRDIIFPDLRGEALTPPKLFSEGVTVMGGGTVAAMVHPADRGSLETLWRIRQKLRDTLHHLGDTVADAPVDDFFGHITLAYVTDDLSEPQYARVKAVLSLPSRTCRLATSPRIGWSCAASIP